MKNWNLRECNIDDLKKVTNFLNKNFSIEDKDFFWKQENIKLKIFNSPIGVGSFIYGITEDDKVIGVSSKQGEFFSPKVIISTGGKTYTQFGTTGDGYQIAENCGHKVTELNPMLGGLHVTNSWKAECSGLVVKDVLFKVNKKGAGSMTENAPSFSAVTQARRDEE